MDSSLVCFFSKECMLHDLWREEMLPHFLILLLLILLPLFILPRFLFYCQVEIRQKLQVLRQVIHVTSLVLKKPWGKPHSLLFGHFILQYIPVHPFKETEISVPLISLWTQSCSLSKTGCECQWEQGACWSLMADCASLNGFWVILGEVKWERAAPHVSSCSAHRDSLLTVEFGVSSYYSHDVFKINTEFASPR